MTNFVKFLAVLLVCAVTTSANAEDYKLGNLMIMKPEIPATIKSAPVSAGYLMIKNMGEEADTLVEAYADFAGTTQLHKMEMVDGVMRMRQQEDGIAIPAGVSVMLEKGGLHIMFMKLKQPMEVGAKHKVTLKFEKAGEIEIDMGVVEAGGMNHSSHSKHSDMEHGEMKKEKKQHAH